MKKIIALALSAFLIISAVFAAESNITLTVERDESKWTDLKYENLPIFLS